MRILAIADDTTGALEVGGQLAMHGVRTLVSTEETLDRETEALVVDAQTRHLSAVEARDRVARLAQAAVKARIPYVYKKTDSTLRGNIGAEFQALLNTFSERPLVYVPAYPKMGRVVSGGELSVDGKPLAETATARDQLNPAREGSIPRLLARNCTAPIRLVGTAELLRKLLAAGAQGSVLICDGSSDEDLSETASVVGSFGQPCLIAGTSGFVGHWASLLPVERSFRPPELRASRCLVISGSLHPASREQILQAALDTTYLADEPGTDSTLVPQLTRALRSQRWAALATPGTCPAGVGVRIGVLTRQVLEALPVDCLVIFGGDTVIAVLRAIGATVIESAGELMTGVPLSLVRFQDRLLVLVTKAGGFGAPGMLLSIKRLLEKRT